MSSRSKFAAFLIPMLVFISLLAVNGILKKLGHSFWLTSSEYWIYPLQTVICGFLLVRYWRCYDSMWPRRLWISAVVGVVVFLIWIAPQTLLGLPRRDNGFDPTVFASPTLYWITVAFRFARLVIVVPLVEEIFWRGFVLRYLISENFDKIAVGTWSWMSFTVVAAAFAFSHAPADWAAAFATGMLYNAVACSTKSLGSCVIAHASTNLLLGLWIMATRQWGFW
jgi:CAAX prenyl protease-like protein